MLPLRIAISYLNFTKRQLFIAKISSLRFHPESDTFLDSKAGSIKISVFEAPEGETTWFGIAMSNPATVTIKAEDPAKV